MKKHFYTSLALLCLHAPLHAQRAFHATSSERTTTPVEIRYAVNDPAAASSGSGQARTTADISYPGSPYCRDTGTVLPLVSNPQGGSFSATPAGLSIDAATGAINLAASQAGNYIVTYSSGGVDVGAKVAVRPRGFMDPVPNQVQCAGAPVSEIAFNGLPGLTYTWSNSNTAIGLAASGSGSLSAFTAQNGGTAPLRATVRVQPAGGTGCSIPATGFTITVNPEPTVVAVSNQTLCAGTATSPVAFTGPVAGTVFSWTNSETGIGLAATGTGDIPAFAPRNESGQPQTATIKVLPRANHCDGRPIAFTLAVLPSAGVISYPQAAYCQSAWAYVQRSGSGSGAFSATPAGLVLDGQSGAVNLALSAPGVYTINYKVGAAAGSCNAETSTQLTVQPSATVNPVPNMNLCKGQATGTVTFSGTGAGYTWTNDNPSIGLAASGTGVLPSFIPGATGNATIRVVPQAGAGTCAGKPVSFLVRVADCTVSSPGGGSSGGNQGVAYISLSPNPVRRYVTVRCEGYSGPLTAMLIGPAGAVLKTRVHLQGNTGIIDLDGLAAGLYVVQVTDPATGHSIQKSMIKLQ